MPVEDHINRLIVVATDRALSRLLGKIPLSSAAMSWYMTISIKCPLWFLSDFVYPQDLLGIPLKQQRKVMACIELISFRPTLIWGKILLEEAKRVARSPEASSSYRQTTRPAGHPPDVRGILASPLQPEGEKKP